MQHDTPSQPASAQRKFERVGNLLLDATIAKLPQIEIVGDLIKLVEISDGEEVDSELSKLAVAYALTKTGAILYRKQSIN
jgi:hypothetical protein